MIELASKLPRTCMVCLYDEGSPQLDQNCKRRFTTKRMWAAIVVCDLWGRVKSEDSALRLFGELCFDRSFYEAARVLTNEEIAAVLRGEMKLTIALEAVRG